MQKGAVGTPLAIPPSASPLPGSSPWAWGECSTKTMTESTTPFQNKWHRTAGRDTTSLACLMSAAHVKLFHAFTGVITLHCAPCAQISAQLLRKQAQLGWNENTRLTCPATPLYFLPWTDSHAIKSLYKESCLITSRICTAVSRTTMFRKVCFLHNTSFVVSKHPPNLPQRNNLEGPKQKRGVPSKQWPRPTLLVTSLGFEQGEVPHPDFKQPTRGWIEKTFLQNTQIKPSETTSLHHALNMFGEDQAHIKNLKFHPPSSTNEKEKNKQLTHAGPRLQRSQPWIISSTICAHRHVHVYI